MQQESIHSIMSDILSDLLSDEVLVDFLNDRYNKRNMDNNMNIPFELSREQLRYLIAKEEFERIKTQHTQANCDHSYGSPTYKVQKYNGQTCTFVCKKCHHIICHNVR